MSDVPEEPPKNFSRTPTSWDASDDLLLMHLKDNQKLGWKEIASHFQNRTPNACQFRWRRLKSGNLKNPPKSAAVSGAGPGTGPGAGAPESASRRTSTSAEPEKKVHGPGKRRVSELAPGLPSVYSPLANATFTGYEAPTGLHSHMASGGSGYSAGPASSAGTGSETQSQMQMQMSMNIGGTGVNSGPSRTNSAAGLGPGVEVPLDPQAHTAAAGTAGGYFTDISVDPTSNLPHNRPHAVPSPHGFTPRNSATEHPLSLMHNNSIIQIARDDPASYSQSRSRDDPASYSQSRSRDRDRDRDRDRASVSSQSRLSVSSLPSKSMDIPHHHRNSLAHMPILFGGSSISGPAGSGPSSVSGPSGLPHLASTLSSIRNGSIVGTSVSAAYLRRSSIVPPPASDPPKESSKDSPKDSPKDADAEAKGPRRRPASKSQSATPTPTPTPAPQAPVFKIPWSMEEDELLINRRRKELSFAELSILLPQRTEGEIWGRIDALERLKNGHRASVSRPRRRRLSSLGLDVDDDDDFYDDVDSVIGGLGGIDSDDDDDDPRDDDDDAVLLDVDDGLSGQRLHKKRRASSAVNPLSVREGLRGKLR